MNELSAGVVRPFNATREGDVGLYRKSRLAGRRKRSIGRIRNPMEGTMPREFRRREFLRGVAGAVAAIAVGGCAPATLPAAHGKTVLAYRRGHNAEERNRAVEGGSV